MITYPTEPEGNPIETIPQTTTSPQTVRQERCSLCFAPAGEPCQRQPVTDHLQRWLDAYRAGRITKAERGEVFGQVVVITRWQVVPERAA